MAVIKRLAFYDNLKFVLIALVLVGHFSGMLLSYDFPLKVFWRWIYMFHMPAFIFVGGVFSKKLYTRENGLRVNVIAFYLLMFICFYTALWAWKHAYGRNLDFTDFNLFSVGSIPWYFEALAFFGMSLPIVAKIRGGAKVVIPVSIALSLIAGFSQNFNDFMCLGRTAAYAPFYFAGYFTNITGYAEWIGRMKKKVWPVVLAIAVLILVFLMLYLLPKNFTGVMSGQSTGHNPYPEKGFPAYVDALIRLMDIGIASVMIIAVSLLIPMKESIMSGWGSRTLQVYVLHPFIYYPIDHFKVLEPLAAYMPWAGWAVCIGAVLLAILLAIPKAPENLFRKLRRSINIDNAV